MPLLRMIAIPFRSELCLFLTLSLLSLVFGILESLLYTRLFEDVADSPENLIPNTSEKELSRRHILETKSVFFVAVVCLFGFTYLTNRVLYFLFFGGLSDSEHTRLSRMLFKFVILRSVILSGALNVSNLLSVFSWLVWFSALGITHSCALIATVRCGRFSASSRIAIREWLRMVSVIVFLFSSCWCLLFGGLSNRYLLADVKSGEQPTASVPSSKRSLASSMNSPTAIGVIVARVTGYKHMDLGSIDVAIYLVAEVVLLLSSVLHILAGLLLQAYDRWNLALGRTWPQQNVFSYYLDLVHVVVYHFTEIIHYSHLLLWSRIFSVASLVVFLHIRSAYSLLASRIRRHLAYRRLSKFIADNYFLYTAQTSSNPQVKDSADLADKDTDDKTTAESKATQPNDICAICWEPMLTWRKLPCRHNFHEPCLRSWLEQNPSCPTCRRDLNIPPSILPATTNNHPPDQLGLGLLLRDFTRTTRPLATVANAAGPQPGPTSPASNRNLFAAAVGLNLGVSIGSAPMVTAAAQAVARETLPITSVSHGVASVSSSDSNRSSERRSAAESSSTSSSTVPTGNVSQSNPPTNLAPTEDSDQVHRRSFHFDGSRYFSWLPSLHVELSEVIREVFSGGVMEQPVRPAPRILAPAPNEATTGNRPENWDSRTASSSSFNPHAYELIRLPASLRVPAQEISTMFPQFPLAEIVADLLVTGMPEATVENLIQRPPPSIHTQALDHLEQEPSADHPAPRQPRDEPVGINEPSTSRPVESTNTLLAERRQQMLETARRRFLSNNNSPSA